MRLHSGDRVQELTKRVGQIPRRGKILSLHGSSVEIEWDDGHVSSLAGGYLIPIRTPRTR
ncbi:hypothetical protein HQ535_01665 [bacterium]|nr:hypothetical protein [bacterium]